MDSDVLCLDGEVLGLGQTCTLVTGIDTVTSLAFCDLVLTKTYHRYMFSWSGILAVPGTHHIPPVYQGSATDPYIYIIALSGPMVYLFPCLAKEGSVGKLPGNGILSTNNSLLTPREPTRTRGR